MRSTGVGVLVRAEIRRRWLALALIGLLAGLIGAGVVASVAGARRSVTAYDRLAQRTGQPDATVVSFLDPGFLDDVADLPEVREVWPFRGVVGQVLDRSEVVYVSVTTGARRPPGLFDPLVDEGRLPRDEAPNEVAVASRLAEEAGLAVGDHLPMQLLTQQDFEAFGRFGHPHGPRVDLEIVGTFDLGGNETTEQVALLASPAFGDLAAEAGGGDGLMVRLDGAAGAAHRFQEQVGAVAEDYAVRPEAAELGKYDLNLAADDRDRNQSAASVVARGLLAVGAAGLVIGLLGVGQAVARHQARSAGAQDVLRALGLDEGGRILAQLAPFAVVAAPVAAATTVVGAVALSPLLPIGVARRIEPSPGVEVNVVVVTFGAVVVLALFAAVVGLVARRITQRRPGAADQHGSLVGATRSGLPVPVAVGAGLAFDRGRTRGTGPVRAAIVGAVLAVAAVVGAVSFADSLQRLVETPDRYGSPGDLIAADAPEELMTSLEEDPDVDGLLEVRGFDILVEGVRRDAVTTRVRKGTIGFDYLDGRPPSGPSEIVLGPSLAHRLGVGVGDRVRIGEDDRAVAVVGLALARGDTADRYADNVIVDDPVRRAEGGAAYREALVRFAPGVDVAAEQEALAASYEIEPFEPPRRIQDIAQIRNLPVVLAGTAALLGLALLAHALVVTVRRRGSDLALLRALGGRPRETAVSVVVMTMLIVVVGLALGVPLGLFAGNLAWRTLATSLYVGTDLSVPFGLVLACLPVALAAGLAAAAVPTVRAARLEVARVLRRE